MEHLEVVVIKEVSRLIELIIIVILVFILAK